MSTSVMEGSVCPKCRKGKLRKPKVSYSIFEGKKQPDGVCDGCGAFCWGHPDPVIPSLVSGVAEQREKREPTFGELLDKEEKKKERRREKKRRWRRNRRRRKAMEAEKSRE